MRLQVVLYLSIFVTLLGSHELAAQSADQPPPPESAAKAADEFVPPPNYQKRLRGGEQVYCRQVEPAGSRIKRTECFTRLQLEVMDRAQRAYKEDMSNQGAICADSRCSGG